MIEVIAIGVVVLLLGGLALTRVQRGKPDQRSGDGSVLGDGGGTGEGCPDFDGGGCDGGGDGGGGGD